MRVPQWLTIAVAVIVMIFGLYRMRLAFRKDETAAPKKGLYAMGRRTHLFVGIIYLLLGGALLATSFGFNPFGNMFGPGTDAPTKDTAPQKPGTVPIDQLPPTKK